MTISKEPSPWQAGWAGSQGTGSQLPDVQSGQSLDFGSVEASSLTVQSAVSAPVALLNGICILTRFLRSCGSTLKFAKHIQALPCSWRRSLFFSWFPCSREGLINILLPAEAFLLQRLPTSPSFDHSLYQQFVRYLGAVKKPSQNMPWSSWGICDNLLQPTWYLFHFPA